MKTVVFTVFCMAIMACNVSQGSLAKPMPIPTAAPAPSAITETSVGTYCRGFGKVLYVHDNAASELVAHLRAVEEDPQLVNDYDWKLGATAVRIYYQAVVRAIRNMRSVEPTASIHQQMLSVASILEEVAADYEAAVDTGDNDALLAVGHGFDDASAILNVLVPRIKAVCG